MPLTYIRKQRQWTDEKIGAEVRRVMKEHDLTSMPTLKQLNKWGESALRAAIGRNGGTDYWAVKLRLRRERELTSNPQCCECFAYDRFGRCSALTNIEPYPCFLFKTVEQAKADRKRAEKLNKKRGVSKP